MKIINRWTTGLFTAVVITTGSLGIATLANTETTEPTTLTTETTESTTEVEVQEKISFEYYTITEEAVKNGWTCHTIDRCDRYSEIPLYVYIYDPALIGKHKFNVTTGKDVLHIDFTVVFVDQYNQKLGEETYTLTSVSKRGFVLTVEDYPPGTKYVKFSDITNIIYP